MTGMLVAVSAIALLGFAVGPALRATIRASTVWRDRTAVLQPVDLVSAVVFGAVGLRFAGSQPCALPAFLFLAATGVTLSVIDVQTHRLPNRIVLPAIGVSAGLLLFAAIGASEWWPVVRAVAGALLLFTLYLGLALLVPDGLGFGDVKLAALLGLHLGYLGWGELAIGAVAGFWLGGLAALVLVAFRRASGKTSIPFGPWMLAGAAVAVFLGAPISALALTGTGLT